MKDINIRDIDNNVLTLLEIFNHNKYRLYLVGGCVRDLLLGEKPKDWDLCTNAKPDEIIKILSDNNVKWYAPGINFGTVIAKMNGQEFEITTYRKESEYSDNRHPDKVEFSDRIEEDLGRRDFTINAMALTICGKEVVLIDIYNGVEDIKNRKIRTVGEPNKRFNEDALRIMRAIRFAIRYDMRIEDTTSKAMKSNVKLLDNVSKERITQELEKILTCNKPIREHFIEHSYIMKQIIPEISKCIGFEQNNKYHQHNVYEHMLCVADLCDTDDFIIKLSALLHDIGKPETYTMDEFGYGHFYGHASKSFDIVNKIVDTRIVLTSEQKEELTKLVLYHDFIVVKTSKSLKRAMREIGERLIDKWFVLKQADIDDHINISIMGDKECEWRNVTELMQLKNQIISEKQCFGLKDLAVDGKVIMKELGLCQGKQIGIILSTLLEEVIDEKISNDYNVLIERAGEIVVK